MKPGADYSLYLVTDQDLSVGRPLEEIVLKAVLGGVTVVQLREKTLTTREFVDLSVRIRDLLRPYSVPLMINDRIDVALAVNAQGVHIGQQDMPYRRARRLMGPEAIIGLSVESRDQVLEAEELDVDYLGVSPIFSTPTKTDTLIEWGLDGLEWVRQHSRHPLVAIGSLNADNAADVIRTGADGIAVVSAICSANNPQKAAHRLKTVIHDTRNAMGRTVR
jgi:thiamine-phosphate pyrophosphorylase